MSGLRSLRTQVAIATFVAVLATVAIAFGSAMGLMAVEDARVERLLSPAGRAARSELTANRLPDDPAALADVLAAQQRIYGERDQIDRPVLAAIIICALGAGSGFAVLFANRLSRPLTAVSRAAKTVAAGDFSARAKESPQAVGEAADLVANFNLMARTLESQERQSKEFLAAIAHELRTPLAILHGRLQGLRDGLYASDDETLTGMIRHVEALTRIVSDLSVVSLASAGRLPIYPTDLDLADEISVQLAELRPELGRQGLALEVDLQAAPARADPNRLRQVLLALIDNVVAHARSGGVVRVETRVDADGATLAILDRGDDLPIEGLDRVFEPFWRQGMSLTHDMGRHGLGLSVVASIAQAHGGDVSATRRDGGGACFVVRFPAASALHSRGER